jgi:PhzF family phenazine biosynthesis protein
MSGSVPYRTSAFKQVDVFTAEPLLGNPLAVILDAEGLSAADMQRIAAWTNLSETTFVLPPTQPQADYRLRIFTPRSELPFAGHPSVGTAHALLEAERVADKVDLVQECAAGLLPLRVVGHGSARRIFVRTPRARFADLPQTANAAIAAALGVGAALEVAPRFVTVGPDWVICDLGSESVVRGLNPDMQAMIALRAKFGAVYFAVFGRAEGADYEVVVRAFCPADGIAEDPVTGSANAAIGEYLHASGQLPTIGASYRASQGRELGRDGYVDVRVDTHTGDVEIGGQTVTCVDGTLVLPHD